MNQLSTFVEEYVGKTKDISVSNKLIKVTDLTFGPE